MIDEEFSHDPLVSAKESQPLLSAIARDGGQGGGEEVEIEVSTQEVNVDNFSLFVDRKHVAASIANAVKRASDVHPHPGPVTIKVSNITSAETHRDHLGQDKADLHFVAEESR